MIHEWTTQGALDSDQIVRLVMVQLWCRKCLVILECDFLLKIL